MSVALALLQSRARPTPAENLAHTLAQIAQAASQGAQLISTGELFLTPYFCQSEDHANFALAEPIPGPTTQALAQAAKRHRVVLVASLFERRAPGIYHNTAVVFDADGTLLGRYRKMHIPDDPLYYEKFYFTPGDLGFQCFHTKVGKIGVIVCWDQWFPEAARLTSLAGAEILLIPTAIGWHPSEKQQYGAQQLDAWLTIQRSHAIANGIYVAAINRTGVEGDIEFWGNSFAAAPSGELIAAAPTDQETLLHITCDPAQVEQTRQHWPFLRDRRLDAYANLTKRLAD